MFSTSKEMLNQIKPDWQSSVDGILETARKILEADRLLVGQQLYEFKNHFGVNNFKRLKKIGRDSRLYRDEVKAKLPNSYSTLEEITRLSVGQFNNALEQGLINPDCVREEINAFRLGKKRKAVSDEYPNSTKLVTIRFVKNDPNIEALTELQQLIASAIDQVSDRFGDQQFFIEDYGAVDRLCKLSEQAHSDEWKRREDEVIRIVRKYVRQAKQSILKPLDILPTSIRSSVKSSRKRKSELFSEEVTGIRSIQDLKLYQNEIGLDDWDFDRMMYDDAEFERFKRRYGS